MPSQGPSWLEQPCRICMARWVKRRVLPVRQVPKLPSSKMQFSVTSHNHSRWVVCMRLSARAYHAYFQQAQCETQLARSIRYIISSFNSSILSRWQWLSSCRHEANTQLLFRAEIHYIGTAGTQGLFRAERTIPLISVHIFLRNKPKFAVPFRIA